MAKTQTKPTPAEFDENSPPPRRRPQGMPLGPFVRLPRGEDPAAVFAAWDKEGRVPEGSVLALFVGTDWPKALVPYARPDGVRLDEAEVAGLQPATVVVTEDRPNRWFIILTPST